MTSAEQSGCTAPCAVILVAGRGSRLGDRTANCPKCLVEVNGTPILVNALHRLAEAGVRHTVLVVGYRAGDIRDRIGNRFGQMRICYRDNHDGTTNTSCSVGLGIAGVTGDLLLIEGDVFFEQRVLDDLLSFPQANATVVEQWRSGLDGSVVTLAADRTVSAWIHQKERPAGFSLDGTFKTVNIHRFSEPFVREWLLPAVASQVAADGGREPIETVFAAIVRNGARIYASEVRGSWVEIDDQSDLRAAEALFQGVSNGPR